MNAQGKGVYLWQTTKLFNGDPIALAEAMAEARVDFVAVKIHDGATIWKGLEDYFNELRKHGILVGGWGYVYLTDGAKEGKAAVDACNKYGVDFYLIDAENQAKGRNAAARVFATYMQQLDIPVGMNSYWKPSYHPELPWKELRMVCDFDTPQVYWRGSDPVLKLYTSIEEYQAMDPKLPMPVVAGDMYLEHGLKPTPGQVTEFMQAAKDDENINGVLMWSADQITVVPELWAAFSDFNWWSELVEVDPVGEVFVLLRDAAASVADSAIEIEHVYRQVLSEGKIPLTSLDPLIFEALKIALGDRACEKPGPLYGAVVTADAGLNKRKGPGLSFPKDGALQRGVRVNVWGTQTGDGYLWADLGDGTWAAHQYLAIL